VTPIFSSLSTPETLTAMTAKKDIRRLIRRRRRSLSLRERSRAAIRVSAVIGGMNEFRGARRIAIFAANDGEIDLDQTMKRYPAKNYYLPAVPPPGRRRMRFAPVSPQSSFRKNRYGILEPDVPPRFLLTAPELDLVLAPLVAFDRSGGRIGMGGGYYDATFAFLASRTCWRRPRLIGVAFSFQEVPYIEPDAWDIPLSAVATERGAVVIT
jgi:5-formyltetrahydrofolate cyclo-ligase